MKTQPSPQPPSQQEIDDIVDRLMGTHSQPVEATTQVPEPGSAEEELIKQVIKNITQ